MEFYLVYTESSQFAGGGQWFITKAEDADDAEMRIEPVANEYWYEMDRDEFEKCREEELDEVEEESFEDTACSIIRSFAFTLGALKEHGEECWAEILSEPGLGNSVDLVECTEAEVIKAAKKIQLEFAS